MAVLSVCSVASAASDTWEGARVWSYRSFQKCRCCGLGEPMNCNRGMFGPWGHTRRGIFVPMPTVINILLFERSLAGHFLVVLWCRFSAKLGPNAPEFLLFSKCLAVFLRFSVLCHTLPALF